MEVLAKVRIVLWEGASLWISEVSAAAAGRHTDPHAHHAVQVTINLDGRFSLDAIAADKPGEAIAVAPDATHVFTAEGLIALLFIEPESRFGRAVAGALFGAEGLARVPAGAMGDLPARITAACRAGADDEALVGLWPPNSSPPWPATPAPWRRTRACAGWSPGPPGGSTGRSAWPTRWWRAASPPAGCGTVRGATGLAFRTYVLWLRLSGRDAVASGGSLTQAAHEAGFADSAHFSRTFPAHVRPGAGQPAHVVALPFKWPPPAAPTPGHRQPDTWEVP